MYYVHCNRCLLHLEEATAKNTTLHVTNCGHIFCNDCVLSCTNTKCFICGSTTVRTIILDSTLKPDVKAAFCDVSSQMKSLFQAFDFQQIHIKNLISTYKKNVSTLGNQLRGMNQQLLETRKQLVDANTRIEVAETESARLREAVARYRHQIKKPSPALNNIFRPIASPPVTRRKASQSDFLLNTGRPANFNITPSKLQQERFSPTFTTRNVFSPTTPDLFNQNSAGAFGSRMQSQMPPPPPRAAPSQHSMFQSVSKRFGIYNGSY